ncbi:hypothetical protein E2C01_075312 [Portunus trituberculatus]|uniref:Uncharacterized protein n=1 Tax=Portunus trituberculatus TaxID=210409 RepID=A0A5B7IJS4_PORTR|nr:hypothetical protein [Portunus trituberculatus]
MSINPLCCYYLFVLCVLKIFNCPHFFLQLKQLSSFIISSLTHVMAGERCCFIATGTVEFSRFPYLTLSSSDAPWPGLGSSACLAKHLSLSLSPPPQLTSSTQTCYGLVMSLSAGVAQAGGGGARPGSDAGRPGHHRSKGNYQRDPGGIHADPG